MMYLLNTRLDNLSKDKITSSVNDFLEGNVFTQIATINPEFLLEARKNREFQGILNKSELNIADGVGIRFAFWRYGKNLRSRYTGVDLMWDILKIANTKGLSVYLATNSKGLSTWQETCSAITDRYPDLKISGQNIDPANTENFMQIRESMLQCDIVFVNFGAPEQEIFIDKIRNVAKRTNVRLGIGVGGAFDIIVQKIPRAPRCMRSLGLEWLHRLIKQPRRFGRIFKAVIVFPLIILVTPQGRQNNK